LGLRISRRYGLASMVERGIGCGPASASFSASPMHAPELRPPVHGTPETSGMSGLAAVEVNPSGEFGTRIGVQDAVKTSSSSPSLHWAIGLESVECAVIATPGAMAIVSANPPARSRRRVVIESFVIVEFYER
jgi:hypothetical protein